MTDVDGSPQRCCSCCMEKDPLTDQVLGGAFAVANALGCGFLEKVYENALRLELEARGLEARAQTPLAVQYRGREVGSYFVDLLVEHQVILEIKAVEGFRNEHVAQLLNYLRASSLPVGLLINFGRPRIEYRRYENRFLY